MKSFSAALLLAVLATGCTGGNTPTTPKAGSTQDLTQTWAVQYATLPSFKPYQTAGWMTFLQKRDYRTAAKQLASTKAAARPHAEAAALFRQAALVTANAAIQTYAKTPEKTDPVGAAHLLSVAYSVTGDLDKARAASKRLDGVEDVTTPWHGPWKTWLAGDATWPPDLSALPLELPPVEAGNWPMVTDAPHYAMPVQTEGDYAQKMGDPGSLIALALWHEEAAKKISEDPASVDLSLARYRLPIEKVPVPSGTLSMDFMYGSDMLVAGDAAFMADVMASQDSAKSIAAHQSTSLIASLALASQVNGKIIADKAVDEAAAVRTSIVEMSSKATGNKVERHHRMFADIAYVGIVRNLALVAEIEGNREEGGKLRILAKDASVDHTGCAVGVMSLAAWDTGNRYAYRAQEIIHRNTVYYPSLEVARYGLDVLALRDGRNAVGTPGM